MRVYDAVIYLFSIVAVLVIFVAVLAFYVITRPFSRWLRCRYWKVCEHYRKDSFTCQNGGGDYCGVWRRFEAERS